MAPPDPASCAGRPAHRSLPRDTPGSARSGRGHRRPGDHDPGSPRRGRAGLALSLVGAGLAGALVLVGGSGSEPSGSSATTSPDGAATLATAPPVQAYSDPGQPIYVGVGQQFAIVLDADPAAGLSWVPVAPPDPAILLSIGIEFRAPGQAVEGQTTPSDTDSQVLRYGARALGTAQIALRYSRPGAAPAPGDPTATFTVEVVTDPDNPPLPPPPPSTDTTAAPATTAPAGSTTSRPRSTTTTTGRTTTTT
jgi:hypothetical protein